MSPPSELQEIPVATAEAARKALLDDLERIQNVGQLPEDDPILNEEQLHFVFRFPGAEPLVSRWSGSPEEVQAANNAIVDKLADLCGRAHPEQFSAACNGCGPASWPEERREKLTKWLATFAPAFDVHDCRFTFDNDGTRENFDYANDELEKNCILLANQEYAWYNPLRYVARHAGHIIAALCREFGWQSWKEAYNHKKGAQS